MARHSTGVSNNKVAGSFIATILAILAGIGLIVYWVVSTRSGAEQDAAAQPTCIQGELTLNVAGEKEVAEQLIAAYNSSQPVVRDYCVKAAYTEDLAAAGVYVTGDSDAATKEKLSTAQRTAATLDWPVVANTQVGVASKDDFDFADADEIVYVTQPDELTPALLAASLDPKPEAVKEALDSAKDSSVEDALKDGATAVATNKMNVPSGYTFITPPKDAELVKPFRAVALNATSAVSEDVVRAGADFATATADENGSSILTSPAYIAAAEALAPDAAAPATSSAAPVPSAKVKDTLLLLDTSDVMGAAQGDTTWNAAAGAAIAALAPKIGEGDRSVALWNYSSPLNPGVAQGWRANVSFADGVGGDAAAQAATRFGTGGAPQTYSALSQALLTAADHAAEKGSARVVLVYSGVADDADLAPAIARAKEAGVTLSVIHVGPESSDATVTEAAKELGGTATSVTDPKKLEEALGAASGL